MHDPCTQCRCGIGAQNPRGARQPYWPLYPPCPPNIHTHTHIHTCVLVSWLLWSECADWVEWPLTRGFGEPLVMVCPSNPECGKKPQSELHHCCTLTALDLSTNAETTVMPPPAVISFSTHPEYFLTNSVAPISHNGNKPVTVNTVLLSNPRNKTHWLISVTAFRLLLIWGSKNDSLVQPKFPVCRESPSETVQAKCFRNCRRRKPGDI